MIIWASVSARACYYWILHWSISLMTFLTAFNSLEYPSDNMVSVGCDFCSQFELQ